MSELILLLTCRRELFLMSFVDLLILSRVSKRCYSIFSSDEVWACLNLFDLDYDEMGIKKQFINLLKYSYSMTHMRRLYINDLFYFVNSQDFKESDRLTHLLNKMIVGRVYMFELSVKNEPYKNEINKQLMKCKVRYLCMKPQIEHVAFEVELIYSSYYSSFKYLNCFKIRDIKRSLSLQVEDLKMIDNVTLRLNKRLRLVSEQNDDFKESRSW
jgi:hypothetical protein